MMSSSGKRLRVTKAACGNKYLAWHSAPEGDIVAFKFDRDSEEAIDVGQTACVRLQPVCQGQKGKPATRRAKRKQKYASAVAAANPTGSLMADKVIIAAIQHYQFDVHQIDA